MVVCPGIMTKHGFVKEQIKDSFFAFEGLITVLDII